MIVQNMAAICPYRVGDYLHTENPTHPATSWPGTSWEQVQGRMLMGASDTYPVGSEGGEAEHTLTRVELPNEKITVNTVIQNSPSGGANYARYTYNGYSSKDNAITLSSGFTDPLGSGQAHNNMPPYRATYIWRRTA